MIAVRNFLLPKSFYTSWVASQWPFFLWGYLNPFGTKEFPAKGREQISSFSPISIKAVITWKLMIEITPNLAPFSRRPYSLEKSTQKQKCLNYQDHVTEKPSCSKNKIFLSLSLFSNNSTIKGLNINKLSQNDLLYNTNQLWKNELMRVCLLVNTAISLKLEIILKFSLCSPIMTKTRITWKLMIEITPNLAPFSLRPYSLEKSTQKQQDTTKSSKISQSISACYFYYW